MSVILDRGDYVAGQSDGDTVTLVGGPATLNATTLAVATTVTAYVVVVSNVAHRYFRHNGTDVFVWEWSRPST